MVSIDAFQAVVPGSIPGQRMIFFSVNFIHLKDIIIHAPIKK